MLKRVKEVTKLPLHVMHSSMVSHYHIEGSGIEGRDLRQVFRKDGVILSRSEVGMTYCEFRKTWSLPSGAFRKMLNQARAVAGGIVDLCIEDLDGNIYPHAAVWLEDLTTFSMHFTAGGCMAEAGTKNKYNYFGIEFDGEALPIDARQRNKICGEVIEYNGTKYVFDTRAFSGWKGRSDAECLIDIEPLGKLEESIPMEYMSGTFYDVTGKVTEIVNLLFHGKLLFVPHDVIMQLCTAGLLSHRKE